VSSVDASLATTDYSAYSAQVSSAAGSVAQVQLSLASGNGTVTAEAKAFMQTMTLSLVSALDTFVSAGPVTNTSTQSQLELLATVVSNPAFVSAETQDKASRVLNASLAKFATLNQQMPPAVAVSALSTVDVVLGAVQVHTGEG
jgi:hypothetical protein